uniref:Uncharacterized protein n=1 Tax=Hyaloperonospora arabidopsidis (strain Emoy2) TaxID=559515 RepID=M4BDR5_HYAAE
MTFQSKTGEWTPRKTPPPSVASATSRTIPSVQRSHSNRRGDSNSDDGTVLAAARSSAAAALDSRAAARRLRRQYPHQPIAQLDHHYHHHHQQQQQQYQRPVQEQREDGTDSRRSVDVPRTAAASSASSLLLHQSTRKVSSTLALCRRESGARDKTTARHDGALDIPVFRSHRKATVSGNSNDGSPCGRSQSGHNGTHDVCEGESSKKSTPYEQWRRLKRARTASGNSCASTSSTSSFASYVVNPKTGRHDFGLGSDDEVEGGENDLDSVVGGKEEEEEGRHEELPSVLHHIIAPSLPPPPYPVDPYHFYCKSKPTNTGTGTATTEVTSILAALFTDCGIEAIFHPLKCKFKCLKYVHYSHVEFVVRVYAHQRTLLVEFQRRSGSVLLWDGLYRILHQKLVLIVDTTALPCSQSSGQKRVAKNSVSSALRDHAVGPKHKDKAITLTPSQSVDHGTQIWRALSLKKPTPSSGVEAMKIMLTSRCLDAMREGCAGLAELTEDVQNSCLVAHAELVVPLIQAVEATDLSMSRCAIGALANIACAVPRFPETELALAQRTAQQLRLQAIPVVLAEVEHANMQSLFSIELLRECARALGAFARLVSEVDPTILAASSVHDERCSRVLRLHVKHRDAQLASHCRAALEQLYRNVSSSRYTMANK